MLSIRDLHPSFIGVIDPNCSSNSDVGMSGSFVPYAKTYDRFYFSPEWEPCERMYNLATAVNSYYEENYPDDVHVALNCSDKKSYEEYLEYMDSTMNLSYYPIKIVEREVAPVATDNT